MYNKALVIGKFMDFHQGHVALMEYALTKATHVDVLVCATDRDLRAPGDRLRWIQNTFGDRVHAHIFWYEYSGLDGKEESDRVVSEQWAKFVDSRMPEVDVIVGSEDYIRYMSEYGDFDYLLFDQDRATFPCSSTSIRRGDWSMRAPEAKVDLVKRVAFIGPESVGKTTAAKAIRNASVVLEQARDHMEDDGAYTFSDLDTYALSQALEINLAARESEYPTLISDSSALTTMLYSTQTFGRVSDTVVGILEKQKFDMYIVFSPDVPLVQDGTRRQSEWQRIEMFDRMVGYLNAKGYEYRVVRGSSYESRMEQVNEYLKLV